MIEFALFSAGSLMASRMEDEITGVQACDGDMLQEHAVRGVDGNKRIVSNLCFGRRCGCRSTRKLTKIEGVKRGIEIRNRVLNRGWPARRLEHKLIYSAAARQNVRTAAGEDDVVSGCPLQIVVRVFVEDEMNRLGRPEIVDGRHRHHVLARRRGAGIVGHAGCQDGIDRRQRT